MYKMWHVLLNRNHLTNRLRFIGIFQRCIKHHGLGEKIQLLPTSGHNILVILAIILLLIGEKMLDGRWRGLLLHLLIGSKINGNRGGNRLLGLFLFGIRSMGRTSLQGFLDALTGSTGFEDFFLGAGISSSTSDSSSESVSESTT